MTSADETVLIDRLIRVESRLVQLMLHLGLDPYAHRYAQDKPRELSQAALNELRAEQTADTVDRYAR